MSQEQLTSIKSIIKRDGRIVEFDLSKIEDAIFQAAEIKFNNSAITLDDAFDGGELFLRHREINGKEL